MRLSFKRVTLKYWIKVDADGVKIPGFTVVSQYMPRKGVWVEKA